jgi:S1-C subfamily serine protease
MGNERITLNSSHTLKMKNVLLVLLMGIFCQSCAGSINQDVDPTPIAIPQDRPSLNLNLNIDVTSQGGMSVEELESKLTSSIKNLNVFKGINTHDKKSPTTKLTVDFSFEYTAEDDLEQLPLAIVTLFLYTPSHVDGKGFAKIKISSPNSDSFYADSISASARGDTSTGIAGYDDALAEAIDKVSLKLVHKITKYVSDKYPSMERIAKGLPLKEEEAIKYLAEQKTLARIKSKIIPINKKYRIVEDSVKIRKIPQTDSDVVKEIGLGSIVQIIGKLPSGWMQVAKEGESIGWVHGDSLKEESVAPPAPQQQAQAVKEPTPPSGTGSGFFVSKMGHVITNAHVVQNCKKVTIGDNANKQVPAEIINTDSSNDLALLKLSTLEMASAASKSLIQKLGIVVVPLASKGLLRSEDVRLGEKVLVAGYPFGEFFSNTIKVTVGVVSATRGAGDDSGQFQLDAAVQPGNSGGPIYDSGGNIVGVVISQLDKLKMAKAIGSLPENVNFGIKASTVRQFLTSSGLPSKKSERTEEKSTEQLAEIAKNQALMVMCLQ